MANLPSEMIDEIFLRLPAESLMRFKSVSHSWYKRICSSNFAKSYKQHHANTMNSKKVIFYPSCSGHPMYSFSVSSYTQGGATMYDVLHNMGDHEYKVVGSCDGLLLVVLFGQSQLYLWNPLTREYVQLPLDAANPRRLLSVSSFAFGFGCATSSNQENYKNYKVIRVEKRDINASVPENFSKVFLYTTQTNIWRRLTDVPYYKMYSSSAVLVNSKLHFLALHVSYAIKILAFDIIDEEFSVVPESDYDGVHREAIAELNGNLCVLCHHSHGKDWFVWVMKEYGVKESWTNLFRIDSARVNNFGHSCQKISPLNAFIDGKLLLHAKYPYKKISSHHNSWIICDNTATHNARIPEIDHLPADYSSVTYEETLISPNAMITKEQGQDNITKEDDSK